MQLDQENRVRREVGSKDWEKLRGPERQLHGERQWENKEEKREEEEEEEEVEAEESEQRESDDGVRV